MIPGITASTRRVTGGGGDLPSDIGQTFGGGYYIGDLKIPDADVPGVYAIIMGGLGSESTALQWKTSDTATADTDSLTDGISNTLAMEISGLGFHPAAQHCLAYAGGGHDDWYFPAFSELSLAWRNLSDLSDLRLSLGGGAGGGTAPYYWSSSQAGSGVAFPMRFSDAASLATPKTSTFLVRPVRRLLRTAL